MDFAAGFRKAHGSRYQGRGQSLCSKMWSLCRGRGNPSLTVEFFSVTSVKYTACPFCHCNPLKSCFPQFLTAMGESCCDHSPGAWGWQRMWWAGSYFHILKHVLSTLPRVLCVWELSRCAKVVPAFCWEVISKSFD